MALDLSAAVALPNDYNPVISGPRAPTLEKNAIKPDYLDFLREQIVLKPRDEEWDDLMKRRLRHLQDFTNRPLLSFHLTQISNGFIESCWILVEPEDGILVYYDPV